MPDPRAANVISLMDGPQPGGAVSALLPIEARDLTYIAGGNALVQGVDLTLAAAGITVVMGPNGAGKSILLRLLHGLLAPSAGSVRFAGRPLDDGLRRRQAMVFQKPVLLRRSVAANVDFVLGLRGRADAGRRRALLAQAGLEGQADQPARLLSGGEQQRLALARALASGPEVLFMDEPTASLDPGSTQRIEHIAAAARDARTKVIFITHDPGQARRLAEDVVFMHRGRVLEHTPADQFFAQPACREAADYMAGRLVL